jgi:uncharacterized membrane protein (DUF2068 family)
MLRLIGVFKVLKGLLMAAGSVAALRLTRGDPRRAIIEWLRLHAAPGSLYLQRLLARIYITHRELKLAAIVFAAYGAMFLTEGIGLLLLQHWAEWMTVCTTAGLIPFEIFELYHRFTPLKLVAFALNVGILVYLIQNVRRTKREGALV